MADRTGQSQSILVIDGEVLVRHAISDYLRECGYVVIEAASTDEAMTVLAEADLAIDAILADAQAPGSRSAFDLRRWATDYKCRAEVILSGNIASAAQKAAELCENGPQLARPYDPQGVVDYIKRLLGGRS